MAPHAALLVHSHYFPPISWNQPSLFACAQTNLLTQIVVAFSGRVVLVVINPFMFLCGGHLRTLSAVANILQRSKPLAYAATSPLEDTIAQPIYCNGVFQRESRNGVFQRVVNLFVVQWW